MNGADVKRRLRALGLRDAALGRHLNLKKDSLSRLLNDARDMSVREAERIEQFFHDVAPALTGEGHSRAQESGGEAIPLYGFVSAAGADRIAVAPDRVLDWIEPPRVEGLKSATLFALRVAGESMEPRLFQGELIFAATDVPPIKGGDCVVELKDDSALVKTYVGRKDGFLTLKQWNPEMEIRLRWDEVRAVHAVKLRG